MSTDLSAIDGIRVISRRLMDRALCRIGFVCCSQCVSVTVDLCAVLIQVVCQIGCCLLVRFLYADV